MEQENALLRRSPEETRMEGVVEVEEIGIKNKIMVETKKKKNRNLLVVGIQMVGVDGAVMVILLTD